MKFMCRVFGNIIRCSACVLRKEVRFNGDFRAAFVTEFGKELKIPRLPVQPLKENGQVRINVNYCSLNRNDVEIIDGQRGEKQEVPFVPGFELSGEVIEIGPDSKGDYQVGDRVLALSQKYLGGLAEQVIVDEKDVWKLPPEVSLKDAAVVACGHATALLAFTKFRKINEKSTILVSASAGGLGLAAVDVAASIFKSKVIAIYDSEGRGSVLRERGAFTTFSLSDKKIVQRIMKETGNQGVDVAYDAIGNMSLDIMQSCLKEPECNTILEANPHYVPPSADSKTQNDELQKNDQGVTDNLQTAKKDHKLCVVNLFDSRARNIEVYRELVKETLEYCEEQLLTPHVSKIYTLDNVNEAIAFIKDKKCTGKVLIHIQD